MRQLIERSWLASAPFRGDLPFLMMGVLATGLGHLSDRLGPAPVPIVACPGAV